MGADPYRYFRLEARELLDQCTQGILELEKSGSDTVLVQRLLRLMHTLKGAARVVRQAEIADRAHAIEDALAPFRDAATDVTHDALGPILTHLDDINCRLRMLSPPEPVMPATPTTQVVVKPPPPKPSPAQPLPDEPSRTIRADVAEMDMVLDGVAETHGLLARVRDAGRQVAQAQRLADVLLSQLVAQRSPGGAPERLVAIADELQRKVGAVERGLGSTVDQMDRELRQLRDAAERLRLVPAGSLFTVLERTALDAARTLGKQVTFSATGGEMRLDSHVLGAMQSALIQLVRNAVAHGIERPGERQRAGKPVGGQVAIAIARRGRRISFECSDDGGGLDLEAIRRVASRRGMPGSDTRLADAAALVRLLLQGGISTSETVTEVSGRGIGLDVVREAIERLRGEVEVRTDRGKGTVFELVVPSSLAALEVLIVEAGDNGPIAIPLDAIRATVRIGAHEILPAAPGAAAVLYGQQAIAFMPLSVVLGGANQPMRDRSSMIVLAGAEGLAAIGVDRLLHTANLVVRPLPDDLRASAVIAGTAFDAEGNPQLVLDTDSIVAAARRGVPVGADVAPAAVPPRILVIDDSLTTRMLEQSILDSAGYLVDTALSAEEGLLAARRTRYALFLVDVEMPGMDGFAFVEQIRADPALHAIPAILVTSRAAPEDLLRGRLVGSQGYIIKSEFDQTRLLELIKPLVR
jgi:two-component system, chemotaxis family, sensor kinase CheA